MKNLPIILLGFLLFNVLHAQNDYIGPNQGSWANKSYWATGQVPTAGDWARIPAGKTTVIKAGYHAEVKNVTIEADAGLRIVKNGSLTVETSMTSHAAVQNRGTLIVAGNLIIKNVIPSALGGLFNSPGASFLVKRFGKVSIEEIDAATGLYSATNTANVNNGLISIHDCGSAGLYNYGIFTNKATGIIVIRDAGVNGLIGLGSFHNHGEMSLSNCYIGISNQDFFHNHETGSISANACNDGLTNQFGAEFFNEGFTELGAQNTFRSLSNFGDFNNLSCGVLELGKTIYNANGGSLFNSGWLVNTGTGNFNLGTIENDGVIEDAASALVNLVNVNAGSIITSIAGPLVANVIVTDPLMIGSYDSIAVVGIYTDLAASISAGSYNSSTSEYTPNAAAVGQGTLYAKFTNASGTCDYVFPVTVTNPYRQGAPSPKALISTYPNPCKDHFNVTVDPSVQGSINVVMTDMQGRKVLARNYDAGSFRVVFPGAIAPGLYLLTVQHDGAFLGQEKVIVE